jgi:hypothetical protein
VLATKACQAQAFVIQQNRGALYNSMKAATATAQNSKQKQMAPSLRLAAKTTALPGVLPTSISKFTIQIQFPSARFQE